MSTEGEWCACGVKDLGEGVYQINYCRKHKAAPDMYEALKYAEAFCEAVGQGLVATASRDMVNDQIKQALAKAEGK